MARDPLDRDDGKFLACALLNFRKMGDSEISRKSLAAAVNKNKHIPAFLLGRKKMPQSLPEYYSPGDESEAIFLLPVRRRGRGGYRLTFFG
jgi:hypothetical protein